MQLADDDTIHFRNYKLGYEKLISYMNGAGARLRGGRMNPPLKWYLQLFLDVRSVEDIVAAPKIAARYLLGEVAGFILDHLKFVDDALVAEKYYREHLARAREIGAEMYCCRHSCDVKDCPTDCQLRDPS